MVRRINRHQSLCQGLCHCVGTARQQPIRLVHAPQRGSASQPCYRAFGRPTLKGPSHVNHASPLAKKGPKANIPRQLWVDQPGESENMRNLTIDNCLFELRARQRDPGSGMTWLFSGEFLPARVIPNSGRRNCPGRSARP